MPDPKNPLHRSTENRLIAGVCGGMAESMGWDPSLVRLVYLVLSLCSTAFPGILVYVILWIVIPESESNESPLE